MIIYTTEPNMTEEEILKLVKEEWGWEIDESNPNGVISEFEQINTEMQEEELNQFVKQVDTEINSKFLIEASLGLWNGTRQARKIVDSLETAIQICLQDLEYCTVEYEKGIVTAKGSHHDGTNYFTIKSLNKRGLNYYDRHEFDPKMTDQELYERLSGKDFTKRIKIKSL